PHHPAVAPTAGGSGARMNRRAFVTGLGAVLAAPLAAEAQQGTVARIGLLGNNPASGPHLREAFRDGLRELGHIESRNVIIEYRFAEGKLERLPALAAELVALQVDVIVAAAGPPIALAARQATSTVPIVFIAAGDPVKGGLVASLSRPGGNLTGLSSLAPDLIGKCMELLTRNSVSSSCSLHLEQSAPMSSARRTRTKLRSRRTSYAFSPPSRSPRPAPL